MGTHYHTEAPHTPPAPDRAGARQWAGLAVLILPVLLISVDMTVLSFAVPHLGEDLKPTSVQLLWIVDVYSFVLAALLVTMGSLGDRIGRRKLLVTGAAAFGLASLAAAFAPSAVAMIAARALLGLAGATLMPSTLSLIRNMFRDDHQRKIAIAIWAAALSAGSALGPVLGGALLEFFWWGSLFLINVPVTLFIVILAPVLILESRAEEPSRLDPLSVALLAAAMFPMVYGIKKLAVEGIAPVPLLCVAVGVALGVVFTRRQLVRTAPMLDVRLFGIPKFTVGVLLNLITLFAMIAALFFLTQYLQIVRGISPLEAGLVLLPGMACAIAAGFIAVAFARWWGVTSVLVLGLVLMAIGFVLFTQLASGPQVPYVIIAFALVCLGMGLTQSLTNDAVLSAAPEDRAGAASAVSETGYELGAALGIAILGSVLVSSYRSALGTPPGVPADALADASEGVAGAAGAAAELGSAQGESLLSAAHAAFLTGVHTTSAVAAVILVAAAALTAWALRTRRPA
ncbi:MFS transporter [Streptomyces sp. WZ.A104]|uniref:MFS transporter n=1 Tax=Streptomyces sp. WZ.A104 TaxID=2023771 RepID=UPI000BBBFE87|nr:MFS transporter [Streptomyces sp. WZ.A104]PCG85254.1 MFS transporter [Streptomyces sp. WZ.A104]